MSAATTATNSSVRNKHCAPPKTNNYNTTPSIDITKEEFARISEALKNKEFRKLFVEYCDEIQDPANRKRYEEEIKQFEAERGVEVEFVNPEAGFVIKTSVDGTLKCFINVAKSAVVEKPTSEACVNPETGARGLNWAIPLAQAAPRDDLDAHGKHCRVFDVIFHPDALYLAERNASFHKCLIDTALDAVEREFKVQLDRTNLKFPKIQFKGISRPTVIRRLAKNATAETNEPHPLDGIYPPKPNAASAKPKILPTTSSSASASAPKPAFTTPRYVIKHRRNVDLAEYTNELDAKLNVTVPRELVVEIELPLLNSTADCRLDVTEQSLYLLSERTGAMYRLKLDLPYAVDDKHGSAHFDIDTRRLCITLPVVQESAQKQRSMQNTVMHLNREDSGVESDIRDEVNSTIESPVEELSDHVDEETTKQTPDPAPQQSADVIPTTTTSNTFLKNSIQYQFPAKFDCNVLDNVMSLVLHVRNVQAESIVTLQQGNKLHLQFSSIGSGYYPTYYAFYMQLPEHSNVEIAHVDAEAWENNVVVNLNLIESGENLHSYLAGLDSNDLQEYTIHDKFKVAHNSRQRKKSPQVTPSVSLSSSLDISVERSECERSVEIEIKPREAQSTCAANTTEDEDGQHGADGQQQQLQKKLNKKQKKRHNKKRRSFSESTCDDIKAVYKHHQQQQQQQQQAKKQEQTKQSNNNDDENFSPEHRERAHNNDNERPSKTSSVAVPKTTNNSAGLRKQRSFSECRNSGVTSSAGSSALPSSFKGILKHYSRYEPRPSISDSCSSIDEYSSHCCSMDASVTNSLRFSHSFCGIPEENVTASLSESCKKTVRFNEVIMKQVFRLDSSILGQRKKNQKRRDRKQRALQRRLSEGDSADYEDNNNNNNTSNNNNNNNNKERAHIALTTGAQQYFKLKNNKQNNNKNPSYPGKKCVMQRQQQQQQQQRDSSLDSIADEQNNYNRSKLVKNRSRARFESESSSDVDGHKNTMMFEMDM